MVQLALKIESISSFRSSNTSNIVGWENQMPVFDVEKSTKLEKHNKNDHNGPVFPILKVCRDKPREKQGQ